MTQSGAKCLREEESEQIGKEASEEMCVQEHFDCHQVFLALH